MKKGVFFLMCAIGLFFSANYSFATDWTIDVTVAKDGSGNYTTISDAISNNPNDGSNYVIFIKNGTYNEKLYISTNNITLLGEDRDNTIITQAILRRIWLESNPNDDGVATININNSVSGLTLANLTVQNNFADLNPDVLNNTDHTMTIRGGGDKIIIVNCNITATGGDTLSLWNTDGGRYYHSGCYFEGYVDYVCPRGYCYISNSDFFGHNTNASIWHDGEGGEDHKLVVKNSKFDGVTGFGLGRCHRVSAFYLLDCNFTANMRNTGGISYAGDSSTADRDKLLYGMRTYFDRSNRETGDYDWHSDNLSTAENSPTREDITDAWTFNNTWNPEKEIHGLLNCAFLPIPGYYAKKISPTPDLSWLPGKDAVSHLLYFGTSITPDLLVKQTDTSYSITSDLEGATRYYWRVDEILSNGDTVKGALWNFVTNVTKLPAQAFNPYPAMDENLTRYTTTFSWDVKTAEVDSLYFYLGSEQNLELVSKQKGVNYTITGLVEDSTYYWRVDTKNELGTTQGELWRFTFKLKQPSAILNANKSSQFFGVFPNPASNDFTINYAIKEQAEVTITIFDIQGRTVYNNYLGVQQASNFQYNIQVDDLKLTPENGRYFLRITAGNIEETFPFIIY